MFRKITPGFVVQNYDEETGKCVEQEFIAGDDVQFEDEAGNPIEQPESVEYFPFEMLQPSVLESVDFVAEYEDGSILVSPANYDAGTGQVSDIHVININMTGLLSREFIIRRCGEEIDVCQQCHAHTMKSIMVDTSRNTDEANLEEIQVCSGGCDNK